MDMERQDITAVIKAALAEDIGSGDVTTDSIFDATAWIRGSFVSRSAGVVAGIDVTADVFRAIDRSCRLEPRVTDGTHVNEGQVLAVISGPARAVLQGERTALNFLQRMSGIATRTAAFVQAVSGTDCTILDTRKTAPGMRALDKLAVTHGGGRNHRSGLYDMVLIKDNHIDAAGSITRAVELVRSGAHASLPIVVECRTLEDVSETLALDVHRILLDNMTVDMVRKAVEVTKKRVPLEVSGNISLDTVRSYAEAGVQYISVGALTHSVTALDISLEVYPQPEPASNGRRGVGTDTV